MERRIKPAGKVFRDPVHNLIRIDPEDSVLLELIDTPEFQRLRRIRQLGVSWITYHGAEHSRFAHSLGVLAFAQRILDRLQRRYKGHNVEEYLKKYSLPVKCAALLHDIGHGPFSHLIERAFKGSNHETRTVSLIRDANGSIQPLLGDHTELVADIIAHASPHTLLTDIVSSQLDADRMDYLLRDSHATGVQYGKYDPDWLINAMCVGLNPSGDPVKSGIKQWRLSLDSARATDAAEQFILARDHMNSQVYFHRVTRGFEVLLHHLFNQAAASAREGNLPAETPIAIVEFLQNNGEVGPEHWTSFDESTMITAFHVWSRSSLGTDPRLARLAHAFLCRERIYGCANLDIDTRDLMKLARDLERAGLEEDKDWGIDDIKSMVYKGIQRRAIAGRPANGSEEPEESILVADGHPESHAKQIELVSDRFKQLDSQARIVDRLYYDLSKQSEFEKVPGFPQTAKGEHNAKNA